MTKTKAKNTPKDLFDVVDMPKSIDDLWDAWEDCRRCPLYPEGDDDKIVIAQGWPGGVLCVGMAPGVNEEKSGIPFQGEPGKLCREFIFKHANIKEQEVLWTNVLGCKPPTTDFGAAFDKKWELACSARVDHLIMLSKPKLIVAMGKHASERFGVTGLVDEIKGIQVTYKDVPVVISSLPAMLLRYVGKERTALHKKMVEEFVQIGVIYKTLCRNLSRRNHW